MSIGLRNCFSFLKDIQRRLPWMRIIALIPFVTSSLSPESCDVAQSRCVQNPDCLPTLRRYLAHCSNIVDVQGTSVCWPRCRRVVPLLLGQMDGLAFARCDCAGNTRCLEQRQRLEACSRGFDSWMNLHTQFETKNNNRTAVECTTARKSCSRNDVCDSALSITNLVCSGVLQSGQCGKACRNSLRTLYLNDLGSHLISCHCGDHSDEDNQCDDLQVITKTVCKRRGKKSRSFVSPRTGRNSPYRSTVLPMNGASSITMTKEVTEKISTQNYPMQIASQDLRSKDFDSKATDEELNDSFYATSHALRTSEGMIPSSGSVRSLTLNNIFCIIPLSFLIAFMLHWTS